MPGGGSSIAIIPNGARAATRRNSIGCRRSPPRCRRSGSGPRPTSPGTGLPREKVLATVVQLLEKSLIRVGNDEYARTNRSFGLTTLRNQHVDVRGSTLKFEFRGKSGVRHSVDVNDQRLARIVKQCRDLPGQELFQYIDDDGTHQDVTSQDVNAYLKEITGEDFTAKDFRTWAGRCWRRRRCASSSRRGLDGARRRRTSSRRSRRWPACSGNTPAVCRKSYIHPVVVEAYMDGGLADVMRRAPAAARLRRGSAPTRP